MGPLATLFSTIDSAKRKFSGLLDNPGGTFEQLMGQMQDYRRQDQQLGDQAYGDPRKGEPLIKDKEAFAQLGQRAFDNVMSFAPAGITVWHGSPHRFDKFDASKIGTGEGAQAYGHGLYLAEAPEVAGSYAQSVKANSGELVKRGAAHGLPEDVASNLAAALQSGKKFDPVLDAARKMLDDPLASASQRAAAQRLIDNEMEAYNAWSEWSKPGNLYKIDLPDEHIAKMLDWDKPLSQQAPEVRMLAKDLGISEKVVGAKFYQALTNQARDGAIARGQNAGTTLNASQAAASDDLRSFGIPGIRYLDGGSRGTGQGTSNFVIFPGNEGLLSILERNGIPLD